MTDLYIGCHNLKQGVRKEPRHPALANTTVVTWAEMVVRMKLPTIETLG